MVAPAVSGYQPGPICPQQHTRQQTWSLSFICLLASREKCVNLTPFRFLPKQNSPSRCLCFESWEAQVNVCTHLGCLITNSDYKWLTALPQQPSSCSPGPGQLYVNISCAVTMVTAWPGRHPSHDNWPMSCQKLIMFISFLYYTITHRTYTLHIADFVLSSL